ncbi:hypothetical protein HCG51_08300 [Tolypothrix sp. PCC 7910]|uniref:hypothetical protein n=1 Tax=Tolypothrix sp. PCC 7910 TaxID=2099387 RepID=UPI0014278652|nr:hypothetical protein [Tolypothrix sp. PCC 7910]QIR36745.1 hypothetical protein HCG51_08300 [Tolypothrix sp. PCC 7910]
MTFILTTPLGKKEGKGLPNKKIIIALASRGSRGSRGGRIQLWSSLRTMDNLISGSPGKFRIILFLEFPKVTGGKWVH